MLVEIEEMAYTHTRREPCGLRRCRQTKSTHPRGFSPLCDKINDKEKLCQCKGTVKT